VTLALPFPDVVGVTQCWRAVATRKSTPAVSGDECSADAEGNRALGATDVNGLTDAVHHHMDDLVITRGQPGLARGQPLVVTDLDQGVGVALRRGGRVRNALGQRTGRGEVLDQPAKRGAVQRVEPTIEADSAIAAIADVQLPAAEPGSSGSAGSGPSGSSSSVAAWVLRASTSIPHIASSNSCGRSAETDSCSASTQPSAACTLS
jgi:hypothetical protein